jgi:hypothetical protein
MFGFLARVTAPAALRSDFCSTRRTSLVQRIWRSVLFGEDKMGVVVAAKIISAVLSPALAASSTAAHDFKVGALDIGHPWSRPTTSMASPLHADAPKANSPETDHQSSNFDHHSCGLMTVGEGIGGCP